MAIPGFMHPTWLGSPEYQEALATFRARGGTTFQWEASPEYTEARRKFRRRIRGEKDESGED